MENTLLLLEVAKKISLHFFICDVLQSILMRIVVDRTVPVGGIYLIALLAEWISVNPGVGCRSHFPMERSPVRGMHPTAFLLQPSSQAARFLNASDTCPVLEVLQDSSRGDKWRRWMLRPNGQSESSGRFQNIRNTALKRYCSSIDFVDCLINKGRIPS